MTDTHDVVPSGMKQRTTGSDDRDGHDLRPTLALVELLSEGDALRAEPAWAQHGRDSKTLLKSNGLRVVLTALTDGASMENADPDEVVAIAGLEGRAQVDAGGQQVTLETNGLATLGDHAGWRVTALGDCLLLLIVGRATDRTLQDAD
jgi:hypothetical protein